MILHNRSYEVGVNVLYFALAVISGVTTTLSVTTTARSPFPPDFYDPPYQSKIPQSTRPFFLYLLYINELVLDKNVRLFAPFVVTRNTYVNYLSYILFICGEVNLCGIVFITVPFNIKKRKHDVISSMFDYCTSKQIIIKTYHG